MLRFVAVCIRSRLAFWPANSLQPATRRAIRARITITAANFRGSNKPGVLSSAKKLLGIRLVSIVSPLRNQSDPAGQVCETRIGAQVIKPWFGRKGHQIGRAFLISFIEPRECLIFFAEPDVDQSNVEC